MRRASPASAPRCAGSRRRGSSPGSRPSRTCERRSAWVGGDIVTVMQIRTLGDPVLRESATPVEAFDDALRRVVDDMLETMYAAPGVGLAGNQVGLRTACFVYDDREGHAGF